MLELRLPCAALRDACATRQLDDPAAAVPRSRGDALACPRCNVAVPVRKRLLLVLPEGDKFEYVCSRCASDLRHQDRAAAAAALRSVTDAHRLAAAERDRDRVRARRGDRRSSASLTSATIRADVRGLAGRDARQARRATGRAPRSIASVRALVAQGLGVYDIDVDAPARRSAPISSSPSTSATSAPSPSPTSKRRRARALGDAVTIVSLAPRRLADVWDDIGRVAAALDRVREARPRARSRAARSASASLTARIRAAAADGRVHRVARPADDGGQLDRRSWSSIAGGVLSVRGGRGGRARDGLGRASRRADPTSWCSCRADSRSRRPSASSRASARAPEWQALAGGANRTRVRSSTATPTSIGRVRDSSTAPRSSPPCCIRRVRRARDPRNGRSDRVTSHRAARTLTLRNERQYGRR